MNTQTCSPDNGTKLCANCHQDKALGAFSVDRQRPDGRRPDCKHCANQIRRLRAHDRGVSPRQIVKRGNTKRCPGCRVWKPLNAFHRDKTSADGRSHYCAVCGRARAKLRYSRPGYQARISRNAYHSSVQRRLRQLLKNRIWWALAGGPKTAPTLDLLGCTLDEFKVYLEKHFQAGMSWANYGLKGWHLGHVRDCCTFDLSDPRQQHACFHYTNLRPQWAQENWRKPRGTRSTLHRAR